MKPGTIIQAVHRNRDMYGIVLDCDNPYAWENTLAFPSGLPTREEVRKHMDKVRETHAHLCETVPSLYAGKPEPFTDRVPVAWDFGIVYWETPRNLREVHTDAIPFYVHAMAWAVENGERIPDMRMNGNAVSAMGEEARALYERWHEYAFADFPG